MRTYAEARQLADTWMAQHRPDAASAATAIEEHDVGWVFHYGTAATQATDAGAGSAATHVLVFVLRNEVPPMPLSSYRSVAESLAAYIACGNVDAVPSRRVMITGWRAGAMPISAITAIRDHSSHGLSAAKALIEECLAGRPARVDARDLSAAQNLVNALMALGFRAELAWDS